MLYRTWFLVSLGCAKNLVDSESLAGELEACGVERVDDPAAAELIVVNTCGFIADARAESIDTVLHYARYKDEGACRALAVVGCLVERYEDELREALPEVDLFAGVLNRDALTRLARFASGSDRIRSAARHIRLTLPHSAYLRIADGCMNRCAYCTIPLIRGSLTSRPMEEVLADARQMADEGVREVSVIAQDITSYGLDRGGRARLPELISKLSETGIPWIRLMYLHPANIDDELIDAIAAAPNVVRYLDIPVQHASTRILRKMGRRIARTKIERLLERLRRRLPGLFVRTTLLVGFPGETKDDFRQAMDFIRDVRPERFGVFTYSDEEDTRAIRMRNKVPAATATRRRRTLEELREEIVDELIESQQGQLIECIVDASAGEAGAETAIGRTYGDAPEVDYRILVADKEVRPGDIVTCRVVGRAGNDLVGAVE